VPADVPLKATAVALLKLAPEMCTIVPSGPLVGLKDVIAGGIPPEVVTVKLVELVPVPTGFVTVIGPLVAPFGTTAASCASEATTIPRDKPFIVTDVAPVKLLPVTVIRVPGGPLVGEKELIVGGAEESTVNLVLEMASLFTELMT